MYELCGFVVDCCPKVIIIGGFCTVFPKESCDFVKKKKPCYINVSY